MDSDNGRSLILAKIGNDNLHISMVEKCSLLAQEKEIVVDSEISEKIKYYIHTSVWSINVLSHVSSYHIHV